MVWVVKGLKQVPAFPTPHHGQGHFGKFSLFIVHKA